MREWKRAAAQMLCGLCGKPIYQDQPILLITFPAKVRRPLVRCIDCEGPAPPDLPARIVPGKSTKRMQPIARTAATFTRAKLSESDWTARILGEKS
jgi:hypothetical protein